MSLVIKDRISETTTTSGTSDLVLGGATPGYQSFAVVGDTNTVYYCITDGNSWEVGLGTYSTTGPTLARTTVYSNSLGTTAKISLTIGVKNVFAVYPAEAAVTVDVPNALIQVPSNAVLPVANGGTGSNTATFSGANITSLNASNISSGTIGNAYTTAASANGASTIVARDATGNFSAGTITATFSGDGSAVTAINGSNISTGTLAVARGGTGANTLTLNNVILGNATSAVQFVAPGTTGNVLTSNGTTWASQAAGGGFASGTVMLFAQTSAPTGWTKDTTNYNNSGLRVVTGAASTGGSVDFTTAFASQTPTITVSAVSGSAGATTLTTPQIPSHTHNAGGPSPLGTQEGTTARSNNTSAPATSATGGDGSHTHPFSFSSATASSSAINLAVKYVDVIRATKD